MELRTDMYGTTSRNAVDIQIVLISFKLNEKEAAECHKKPEQELPKRITKNYSMTKPIATSTCTTIAGPDAFQKPPISRTRTVFSHSPVVMAMITNNRMSNCHDVSAMIKECEATGSRARVCQVASQYINMCMNTEAPN